MSRNHTDRPAPSARPAGDARLDKDGEPLRSMGWSDLDQTDDWPENFIVRPDEPGLGPPAGIPLPVLTMRADRSDEDDPPDTQGLTDPAYSFAPTVFGARLRQTNVEDEEDSEFHADPDNAPETVRKPRSAFANWSFVWLVLMLLLGLATAAWFGLPSLRQGG